MLKIPLKLNVSKFESAWAEYNGYKYGVACNSGTNALYLAVKALGIGEGDEVIVPEFTMAATAWAVSYTGAKPVFVDCRDDLNLDPSLVKITPKTKAIMPVAIYGREYEGDWDIPVIEDMAEAHGIKPRGTIACYSFYQNKIISTEEGGMCLTNDEALADEMRLLANMYFDRGRTYLHPKIGHNFRMTDTQAKLGLKQVKNFKHIIQKRRQIEAWWDKYLPEEVKMPKRDTVWMYDIDCISHQEAIKQTVAMCRYFFKPMSMQPCYNRPYAHLNAYKWSKRGVYLPLWQLSEKEVKTTSEIIKNTLLKY